MYDRRKGRANEDGTWRKNQALCAGTETSGGGWLVDIGKQTTPEEDLGRG